MEKQTTIWVCTLHWYGDDHDNTGIWVGTTKEAATRQAVEDNSALWEDDHSTMPSWDDFVEDYADGEAYYDVREQPLGV